VTSRAIAFVTSVSRPVASAGSTSTFVEEKFAWTAHPRPHCPQSWQAGRPWSGRVRMDIRDGMQRIPSRSHARWTRSS